MEKYFEKIGDKYILAKIHLNEGEFFIDENKKVYSKKSDGFVEVEDKVILNKIKEIIEPKSIDIV